MSSELVQLRSFYQPPGFVLLVGETDLVACVAFLDLGNQVGEIRRLFVRPAKRTSGLGRLLTNAVIEHARQAGFHRLVLSTLPGMTQAQALYRSMGFTACDPYAAHPVDGILTFQLDLQAAHT
jgi:putative acetyltransferase